MTISVEIDKSQFELEGFRDSYATNFEGFSDYAQRVLVPLFLEIPVLTTLRCSVSGFPIGAIHEYEMADTVRHAVATLKLNRFDDILRTTTAQEVVDGIETLADHIETRMYELARPGPALNFKKDRTSESKLSRPRQLCILLNLLLWDGGMFRDQKLPSSDDILLRVKRSSKIADQIIANWGIDESLTVMHASLIELDAKWSIRTLAFTRAEKDKLLELRESHSLGSDILVEYVEALIKGRITRGVEIDLEQRRWTHEVYRGDIEFNANQRQEFSNVILPATKKELAQAEAKTPEGRAKTKEKQAVIDRYADAFASAFQPKAAV